MLEGEGKERFLFPVKVTMKAQKVLPFGLGVAKKRRVSDDRKSVMTAGCRAFTVLSN